MNENKNASLRMLNSKIRGIGGSALDVYLSKSLKLIIMIAPIAALVAGALFTVEKAIGLYPEVSTPALIVFDLICISYPILAWVFLKIGFDNSGTIRTKIEKTIKIGTVILTIFQWNYISYMIPTSDFWAYAGMFVILSAFYFDSIMVAVESVGIVISMAIFWLINGSFMGAPGQSLNVTDVSLRIICVMLTLILICGLTDMGGRILVKNVTEISEIDPLTHLMNRKRMRDVLDGIHEHAVESGTTYSIIVFDIDDFKLVNDNFGHDIGDEVLVKTSNILRDSFRSGDYIFRWGGEEFLAAVICDVKIAAMIAERVVKRIEAEQFGFEAEGENLTITAGVAEYKEPLTLDEVIKLADEKMFEGKRNGKNQVVS